MIWGAIIGGIAGGVYYVRSDTRPHRGFRRPPGHGLRKTLRSACAAALALRAPEQHGHVASAILEAVGEPDGGRLVEDRTLEQQRPVLGVGERGLLRSLPLKEGANVLGAVVVVL